MTVTLAELQERYPHGSRWGRKTTVGGECTVVGWSWSDLNSVPQVVVKWDSGSTQLFATTFFDEAFVPPAPPCPVTEAVTLRNYLHALGSMEWSTVKAGEDRQTITLHPPGTVLPEGTESGQYTWHPLANPTWTETPS